MKDPPASCAEVRALCCATDDGLAPTASIVAAARAHASGCPSCAFEFVADLDLITALRAAPEADAPGGASPLRVPRTPMLRRVAAAVVVTVALGWATKTCLPSAAAPNRDTPPEATTTHRHIIFPIHLGSNTPTGPVGLCQIHTTDTTFAQRRAADGSVLSITTTVSR